MVFCLCIISFCLLFYQDSESVVKSCKGKWIIASPNYLHLKLQKVKGKKKISKFFFFFFFFFFFGGGGGGAVPLRVPPLATALGMDCNLMNLANFFKFFSVL